VTERLHFELDADRGDAYLTATINEVLRRKPVLPFAEPRLVVKPITIGGIEYPPGVALVANPYLTHHDPQTYPDPYAFLPERFLEARPGTYSWIPFGGGTRRCTGLHFAMQEIKLVLGAALERYDIHPAQAHLEATSRRGVTICPAKGGRVILAPRTCQQPTFDTRIAAQPTDPEAN
jgi:cytochrome P450